ncbi:hypothetical protein B0H67DRAFT_640109 [Lasiosphaeris hirsuta]|uniref:Diphthamide biosynthesis protein 4 n=1 Tax=Lasiosphaeris hirsuta TaxID=260670 RepID=A0AA40BCS7_9PEZI|nr:hypothetical protein B0H67DRAFT_640109 [Lasiosphaeris hirsuta]
MSTTTPNSPTYYQILSLSPSTLTTNSDPSTLIKRAYRRALLSHHPDKKPVPNTNATTTWTVDQISTAYAVLSSPSQRRAYDAALLASQTANATTLTNAQKAQFQTGIEPVDLDDLSFASSPAGDEWYRSCRCGNPRGFRFGEDDLEEAADLGELMVGCADCSLWLRVQFAVVEEEEEKGGNGAGEGGSQRL